MAEQETVNAEQLVESAQENLAPEEKMLPQSQVDEIVGRRVAEAQAKARKQAQAEYEAQMQRQREEENSSAVHGDEVSRETSADAIYQQVQERFNQEMERKRLEDQIAQVANSYQNKVAAAKSNYEDFDDITANFDPAEFPQLVFLVANMDNAGDLVYEMAKNPQKLAYLDDLAIKSPRMAQAELAKLSKSISDNRAAQLEAQNNPVSPPLGRLQPSQISGNNGKMSIRDLKNQPWLRG